MVSKIPYELADLDSVLKSFSIPRLIGSEGERKTIAHLDTAFNEIGLKFAHESFKTTLFWIGPGFQWGMILAIGLSTLMLILGIYAPFWNLILVLIIAAIGFYGARLGAGSSGLPPVGKMIQTENLIAKIPPTSPKKGIILFNGHHDTKSQPLTTIQRTAFITLGALGLILAALIFVIDAILSIGGLEITKEFRIISYIGVGIAIFFATPLAFNGVYNTSPGALDNASSIVALYTLAKYFHQHALSNFEMWFVFTGGEEIGMTGAANLLKTHHKEFDPSSTFVINFDMIGRKGCPVEIIKSTGILRKKLVNPYLINLATEIGAAHGEEVRGFHIPIGASTDRFIFGHYGIPAMDFINQRAAFETHSKNDTAAKFDANLAGKCIEIAADMAIQIDETH